MVDLRKVLPNDVHFTRDVCICMSGQICRGFQTTDTGVDEADVAFIAEIKKKGPGSIVGTVS
jgi:hypothetical protein